MARVGMTSRQPLKPAGSNRNGLFRGFRLRYVIPTTLLFAAGAFASEAPDALIRRYPFDPACPWGRVNNGKGMILRCISEDEAGGLLDSTPVTQPASAAAEEPEAQHNAGSAAAESPTSARSTLASNGSSSTTGLEVSVGRIIADKGELNGTKLQQPVPRYARCVSDHGGLRERSGEVQVRFLVRRAGVTEGVSVLKRTNVTPEAARCVADIVDNRRVGVPAAPLVGGTVVVKFNKISQ